MALTAKDREGQGQDVRGETVGLILEIWSYQSFYKHVFYLTKRVPPGCLSLANFPKTFDLVFFNVFVFFPI